VVQHVEDMGKISNTHTVLGGKFEITTPLRMHWSRCKSNNRNTP